MKNLAIAILTCLFFSNIQAQNHILQGLVRLQSSGSKPLSGVRISSFGANAVVSKSSGMFKMTIPNKQPEASLSLIVDKTGYELINEKELERCILRGRADDLLIIVMAKKGERDKQALVYYNIIVDNANAETEKELALIRKKLNALDEDDQDRQVLYQQIDALQKDKERLINQAEELAKKFAAVDLDQASALTREAYQKLEQGDIKGAIAVLDDEVLAKTLAEARQEREKAKARALEAEKAFRQSIKNYMVKAQLCIVDGNYDQAYHNYIKAIEADTTHFDNLRVFWSFLHDQRQYVQLITYATKLKALARYKDEEGIALNYLGIGFKVQNEYDAAEVSYKKALEIYRTLAEDNPQAYLPDVATILNNLALLHDKMKQYHETLKAYSEVLEIDTSHAYAYNNRANTYRHLKQYKQAKADVLTSLELDETNGWAYATLAMIYADTGNEKAFYENLRIAIEKPLAYPLKEKMEEEETLQRFRDDKRFRELVELAGNR